MCKKGLTMAQSLCLFTLLIVIAIFGYVSFALNLSISSIDDHGNKVEIASNSVTMLILVSDM